MSKFTLALRTYSKYEKSFRKTSMNVYWKDQKWVIRGGNLEGRERTFRGRRPQSSRGIQRGTFKRRAQLETWVVPRPSRIDITQLTWLN